MIRRSLTWLALAALVLTLAGVAQAGDVMRGIKQRGEIRIGTTPDNPPMCMRSKDGKLMGYDIDMAAMVAEAMGVKLRLVPLAFPDLLQNLKEGKIDLIISGMTMTAPRNTEIMFAGPYLISGQSLLARVEMTQRHRGPSDFNRQDVTVAAAKGTTSLSVAREIMPQAQIMETDTQDSALRAVLENKAHVLMAEHSFCVVALLRFGDEGLSLLDKPFTFEPLGIALLEDALLANWLDNFLMTLRGTGRQEMLNQRWFKDGGWLNEMETNRLL